MIKPTMYHINEECVDVKVGILLSVADDTGLHHTTSTLNLQAGRCHTGQLEALQVTQPPCQDLKCYTLEVILFVMDAKQSAVQILIVTMLVSMPVLD